MEKNKDENADTYENNQKINFGEGLILNLKY